MNKKSFWLTALAYAIWGIAPLYWHLLDDFTPWFTLANRIFWSAVLLVAILLVSRRMAALRALFRDRRAMRYLVPAALIVTLNWGIYIYSMSAGRVLDASLGYFINPLMVAFCGAVVFREKLRPGELVALLLAAGAVLFLTVQAGVFPGVSLALAATFAAYGVLKKIAHVDGTLSVCVETLLIAPLALLYAFGFAQGGGGLAEIDGVVPLLLLAGTSLLTATPLVLYARGVNDLPFVTVGFLQYISPTMSMFCGLLLGETLSRERLLCFCLIWVALAIFSVSLLREEREKAAAAQQV